VEFVEAMVLLKELVIVQEISRNLPTTAKEIVSMTAMEMVFVMNWNLQDVWILMLGTMMQRQQLMMELVNTVVAPFQVLVILIHHGSI
jgi:hypothetical protein